MVSKEEISSIRELKFLPDDDNIRFKEEIKRRLFSNKFIIHFLDNKDLDESVPDEYVGVSILPYLLVPNTQTTPKNYICFKSDFNEFSKYNPSMKYATITFTVLCESMTAIDQETGISRHDLIAYFIKDMFNHSNMFGTVCTLVSDKESVTDTNYASRTLIFEVVKQNSYVKTKNGETKIVNNEIKK